MNSQSSIQLPILGESEQAAACCAVAREKLQTGDYEAGCAALRYWWNFDDWPRHSGLHNEAAAELLLVAGTLSGWVASTKTILGGRKPAEALLSASIAMSEQMGDFRKSSGRPNRACVLLLPSGVYSI